jgi:hypothetical protein
MRLSCSILRTENNRSGLATPVIVVVIALASRALGFEIELPEGNKWMQTGASMIGSESDLGHASRNHPKSSAKLLRRLIRCKFIDI